MICCSILAASKSQVIKEMIRASSRSDILEIRLDSLQNLQQGDIQEIVDRKQKPIILACRKSDEGGQYSGTEKQRINFLKGAKGADYIDIELSAGKKTIQKIKNTGSKIIVSYHNFLEVPDKLDEIYCQIKSFKPDIVKIACMAKSIVDNIKIFNLIKKAKSENVKIIALCMGKYGEISRILNLSFGSFLTYTYLYKETAPGQIKIDYLKWIYRADKLKFPGLKIYGLVGNPISKSKGYIVHNLAFKRIGLNAVYLNFLVDDIASFIDNFKNLVAGFSVTMPFKQQIINHLDRLDDSSKKIGAVNTVTKSAGKLIGSNTDYSASLKLIKDMIQIKNKNALVIGAGGFARGVAYALKDLQAEIMITNRTVEKGKKLALELSSKFVDLNDIEWSEIDLIVNATSIGMYPKINDSPVEKKNLHNLVVFDCVYNPVITKLIDDAGKNGCRTISGLKLFCYQAAAQFETWTAKKADMEEMEKDILEYALE